MKEIDKINLNENEPEILRYLYMVSNFKSCQEIADDTQLTVHQVRYRMPSLDSEPVDLLEKISEENDGDIEPTKKYMLNDRGRQLVSKRDLKKSKSADNSVRIDGLDDDVKELKRNIDDIEEKVNDHKIREELDELQEDIDKIKNWCENFNEQVAEVINEHEERLAHIESVIDENN